jgi:hypothetical protein
MHAISPIDEEAEKYTKHDISNVGVHVIKVTQNPEWMRTQIVVVTKILIPSCVQNLEGRKYTE